MSVRERFFKKMQQQNPPMPEGGSVGADIQAFCRRMEALEQQLQQWFAGSGISVMAATRYLQDLSTVGYSLSSGASRYEITTLRIQHDTRSVTILPEQLYRGREKGCVTLTVDTPDRLPAKQRFCLSMAPEAGWFIRPEHQPVTCNSMMTEDVFFRVIENLA